jgi:hypothetical protein
MLIKRIEGCSGADSIETNGRYAVISGVVESG